MFDNDVFVDSPANQLEIGTESTGSSAGYGGCSYQSGLDWLDSSGNTHYGWSDSEGTASPPTGSTLPITWVSKPNSLKDWINVSCP
jgi:hypothetical protein